MFDDIRQLIDTLLKVEALHTGATTPGERDATPKIHIIALTRKKPSENEIENNKIITENDFWVTERKFLNFDTLRRSPSSSFTD